MTYVLPQGDILEVYGQYGRGNLSGWDSPEVRTLVDSIDSMKGETIQESKAITQMVDAMQPGIGSDVTVISFLTAGIFGPAAGVTARQFLTARDAANALYERATSLINEWEDLCYSNPDVSLSIVQDYHRRFKEVLDAHKEFLGKTTDIVEEGPEVAAQKSAARAEAAGPKGPIAMLMQDALWYGGLAAVGWFVVIPWLKKRGTGA